MIKNSKQLLLLLILIIVNFQVYSDCSYVSGPGLCIPDSINGCHVASGTTCRNPDTPAGCRIISCNSSCPTSGYYAPYGSSVAWDAFSLNKPSSVSITKCLISITTGGPSGSSGSTGSCTNDGEICNTNSIVYLGINPCVTCCNPSGPADLVCLGGLNPGAQLGRCGSAQASCPQLFCGSGSSCIPY